MAKRTAGEPARAPAGEITGAATSKVNASSAGAKVVVASRLPMALEMQHCEKRSVQMKNGNNAWVEDVYTKVGPIVIIAGTAYPNGQIPEGMPVRPEMAGGAALTAGVDAEFFARWLAQNERSPMVMNGLVFAHESIDRVKGIARETKDVQSGLQALNPKSDTRMPKKITGKIGSISVGDAAAAEAAEAG